MLTDEQLKNLSPHTFQIAWWELYKCFAERMQQEEIELMDGVLVALVLEWEDGKEHKPLSGKEILDKFTNLDTRKE